MGEDKLLVENNRLILDVTLQSPRPSKSGKTNIVYSTNGFVEIAGDDGKIYKLSLNLITKK